MATVAAHQADGSPDALPSVLEVARMIETAPREGAPAGVEVPEHRRFIRISEKLAQYLTQALRADHGRMRDELRAANDSDVPGVDEVVATDRGMVRRPVPRPATAPGAVMLVDGDSYRVIGQVDGPVTLTTPDGVEHKL